MDTSIKSKETRNEDRILARKLARELTKDELFAVSGGQRPDRSSSSWSSSGAGEGDDGGADD